MIYAGVSEIDVKHEKFTELLGGVHNSRLPDLQRSLGCLCRANSTNFLARGRQYPWTLMLWQLSNVGHVPWAMSSVCSLFLRRNSSLVCEVTTTWEQLAWVTWDIPVCRGVQNWFQVEFANLHRSTKFAKVFTRERNLLYGSQSVIKGGGLRNKHCTHGCDWGQIMTIQNCMWLHDHTAKLQVSLFCWQDSVISLWYMITQTYSVPVYAGLWPWSGWLGMSFWSAGKLFLYLVG